MTVLTRLGVTCTYSDGRSRSWKWNVRLGRVGLGFLLHRHAYPTSSDRWVFQPCFVYDQREKNGRKVSG